MPKRINYKGELYFATHTELKRSARLIKNDEVKIDATKLKLTIDITESNDKEKHFDNIWKEITEDALSGMILVFHDENFQDIICANREESFNADKPYILLFSLQEFEKTHGKLNAEIPEIIYNSPFYIYDPSLKQLNLKFEDEIDINDEEGDIGFDIARKIWLEWVSQSTTALFHSLLKKHGENESYTVGAIYGFAPGYDMNSAMKNIEKYNFLTIRWDEFWN